MEDEEIIRHLFNLSYGKLVLRYPDMCDINFQGLSFLSEYFCTSTSMTELLGALYFSWAPKLLKFAF